MDPKNIQKLLENCRSLFFCGIGGISMSSLALYAKKQGKMVRGSDIAASPLTEKLERSGISVFPKHAAENLADTDLFIYSGAVGEGNAEFDAAKEKKIPMLSRAEYLGGIMRSSKTRIGIAGCHGKSTVTGMIAKGLLDAGKDPAVFCGAELPFLQSACRFGTGEFLFEACEYKDSFLSFSPNVAVLLNIGYDHPDYFKDLEAVKASFRSYAKISSEDGGSIVADADDPELRSTLSDEFPILYGIRAEDCDYRAVRIRGEKGFYSFDVLKFDEPFFSLSLSVPGAHNVKNALAALTVLDLLGVDKEIIRKSLSGFSGIARRMERKGSVNGAPVYSDYAHHPDEIRAVIRTAKEMTDGRVIAVFEPHTYTRLKKFYGDFVKALKEADVRIFTEIYPARETNTLGMSSVKLAHAVDGLFARDYREAGDLLLRTADKKDLVLVLGAGTVDAVAERFKEE